MTGGLCVIYYDDREADTASMAAYVSTSYDGGNSWTDLKVSDYIFTPVPIAGLAFSYFGDYLGIQSDNMKVYPVFTDDHDGERAMAYVSPFNLGPNPGQPWVTYYSDSLATVSGTGNVPLNYGDSLHLSLGLKNAGDHPDAGISAVVTSPSPYILMTDSTAVYGPMNAGEIKVIPDGFAFKVSDTIPDNLKVRFDVRATGTDSVWYSHFSIDAHAPSLKINGITILDTISGNRNGRLDPGETARVIIPTANTGDFACPSTYGLLSTNSPWITLLADSAWLDNIPARQSKNAVFTIKTDAATPVGSGADLVYEARSGLYNATSTFRVMIGQVVEDWETGTLTKFPWQPGGAKPWEISGLVKWEGNFGSESGPITDYQNSQMFLNYTSAADDSISFYLRTSSEQDYDFLMFSIDGVLQDQWSGETPWTRVAYRVAPGQHVFKWIYLKDLAFGAGMDKVWVDFIALPPPVLPWVNPGPADTICAGSVVAIQGSAQNFDSLKWTSTGDGSFANDTLLSTTYLPGTGDLVSGHVSLRLTGYSPYGSYTGDKQVLIRPKPVASFTISPSDTVCLGQAVQLTADDTGVSSWLWTPGNFTTRDAIYDTAAAGGPGTHLIRLITMNTYQCANHDSAYLTFRDCNGIPEPEPEIFTIFPNPGNGFFSIEGGSPGPGTISLSVTNVPGENLWSEKSSVKELSAGKKINLSFLPDGVYLLSLKTPARTITYPLVIRK